MFSKLTTQNTLPFLQLFLVHSTSKKGGGENGSISAIDHYRGPEIPATGLFDQLRLYNLAIQLRLSGGICLQQFPSIQSQTRTLNTALILNGYGIPKMRLKDLH
jgi:hypothetical protein